MNRSLLEFKLNSKLMGSAFELVVVHESKEVAQQLLMNGRDEIQRIENLLSEFKTDSLTSMINQNAGRKAITVNEEVFSLLKRCIQISDLTSGHFDISVGPLKKLYNFKNKQFKFPSKTVIKKTLNQVGYKKIICSETNRSVFLKENGMHISFAAIGKGYAADCVKRMWLKAGLKSGIINASGDLTTIGKRANGSNWRIGILKPGTEGEILFYIPVNHASVATSGDKEQFFIHQNTRYSHNINPITGLPLVGIKSISVFSPSAELSDALATAVYVKGAKKGLAFINQLPNTHCIIIDINDKVHFSEDLKIKPVE